MGSYVSLALCCVLYHWSVGSLGLSMEACVCPTLTAMWLILSLYMWNENCQDKMMTVVILVRLKETIQVNTFKKCILMGKQPNL